MTRFILRRSISSIFVILAVIIISLWITRLAPSNPCLDEEEGEACRCVTVEHSLDRPVFPVYSPSGLEPMEGICADEPQLELWEPDREWIIFPFEFQIPVPGAEPVQISEIRLITPANWGETQAAIYLTTLARGSLGDSMITDRTVAETLGAALPYTIQLGIQSLLFAILLGVPAGLIAGLRQNTATDYSVMTVAMVGVSIPNFVLGPLLILFFSLYLGWFSAVGWYSWQDSILPTVTLGLFYTAYVARLTRGGILEIIRKDYIRTARAKGLKERTVVLRHALKGALLPVVSYLGPAFAAMLAGSVVVEEIFNLPGVGTHFIRSALNRDYNLVLGTIILYSSLLVFLNLVVDILYTVLDPRVDYDDE